MNQKNDTTSDLKSALEKLGAREFEIVALTMIPDRGLAALDYAIDKGVEHPIAYAIKLFDSDSWNPAGEVTRRGTNLSVEPTHCCLCGGDRFVVVGTRPVVASQWHRDRGMDVPSGASEDEYAPCPECNPTDTSFWRHDGTQFRSPDPAKVREMMDQ